MSNVIQFPPLPQFQSSGIIKIQTRPNRQLSTDMIKPAETEKAPVLVEDHRAEPIKSIEDINRISNYLKGNGRYRDNMLFICGINFGLRISDLLQLRFSCLIDNDFCFKTSFPVFEIKTRNTRKRKHNRYLTINDAVVEAVTLYLEHHPCKLDDYMFRCESNRSLSGEKPLDRSSADRILKAIIDELGMDIHISTHSLRKTFGYHQMMMSNNDPRKLLLLQKIFGHSTSAQTMDYIGITTEEIEEAYMNLNLGLTKNNDYSGYCKIEEESDDKAV